MYNAGFLIIDGKVKEKNKFQTGNVITITTAHFLHDVYSSFLAPILPLLITKFNMSLSLAGLLTVVQRVPSLLNPLVGLAADKLPMRYFLIFAPTVTATSMSLLGVAPSYVFLVVLLLFMGIGASMFHVPGPVMMRQVSGDRIGKGMSFFMLGGEVARSVGPLVILGAVSLWGLEGTYKLIPFGLLASFILYFKLKDITISDKFKNKEELVSVGKTVGDLKLLFSLLAGIIFFTAILKGSLTAFLPTYITSKGESLWTGGIALSILQITGAAGSFLSGTISDKLGRRKTLLVIAVVSPVLTWMFILSTGVLSFAMLLLLGLFIFGTTPILLAIINDNKSQRPSLINGIFITINFLTSGFAVWLVGFIGDNIGLEDTYRLTATLSILSIPFILKLSKINNSV